MCAWKQFTLLRKLKLHHFSLQGRFDMLLSWCVVNNFSVCFLTGEHNSNYFQSLAFSHPPFTSFESIYSGSAAGPARLYCLTTAILQCDCLSHSSCGVQVNWLMVLEFSSHRWKIWMLTRANACFFFFFFPSSDCTENRHWAENKWATEEKEYCVTMCTMGYLWNRLNHSVLGRNWKTSEYEMFRLSLKVERVPVSSQEADTDQEIYRQVKQEGWRKTNRGL